MFQLRMALTRAMPASFVLFVAHGALAQEVVPEPAEGLAEEHTDLATRWKVNDADPMEGIPGVEERNADPMEFGYYLQDMLYRAEGAYRNRDFKKAIKYYKPLSIAVPNVARSFSRLCDSYARLGETVQAIESCRTAISTNGAKVIDHVRYIDLLLRKPSFGATDARDVTASLDHLREHAARHPQVLPGARPPQPEAAAAAPPARAGWDVPGELASSREETKRPLTPDEKAAAIAAEKELMKKKMRELFEGGATEAEPVLASGPHLPTQIELSACRLAVRAGDMARLPECMGRLREYNFPEQALLPFKWAEALQRRDEARAAALLAEAEKSGVSSEVLASMLVEQRKVLGASWTTRLKERWVALAGLAALLLSSVLFFSKRRSARTRLPSATPSDAPT